MADTLSGHQQEGATLQEAYMHYLLEHGKRPASVYKFMKDQNKKEAEFYDHFNSFKALEKAIWQNFFEQTLARLRAEERYHEYSVREKMLAFFFTWIEVLKEHRSYVLFTADKARKMEIQPDLLKYFKEDFISYMNDLVEEGMESGEIQDRPIISRKYADGLWGQALLILKYWVEDDSPGFEHTDALIEKSVNLSFDLMGRGAVDSFLDLAKFLFRK
jgi:AcrR family transcriptional regulator